MRRTALFITIFLSLSSYAQKKYDFDFTNTSLQEAVNVLSRKHKFKFSYNPKAIKDLTVDRKVKASSDAELISELFEEMPFKIQVSDGVYLLIPRKKKLKPTKLAGKINDQATGKPLAFAHVKVNNEGTISNQDGEFSLPAREDTLTLQISYIGYKPLELQVPPTQKEIVLNLEQNPTVLQEVILNSKEFNDLAGRAGFFSLNPDQFNALPTLGETDVFKSLQLLPGIQATDETASGLAVRGGSPSQNLILMDGFNLYHLDHFFGIFSTLNPNVINNVNIYKGGFGAEYGGRISSVVDVTGKTGSFEKFKAGAGINLLSMNGYIETPIGSKTSLIIGGRRSFTDILNTDLYEDFLTSNRQGFLESISSNVARLELTPSFNFYDINGKIQHRISDRSIVEANLFLSEDFYSGDYNKVTEESSFSVVDEAYWANEGLSLNWKQTFGANWNGDFGVSNSAFRDNASLSIQESYFDNRTFVNDTIEANDTVSFFYYNIESSVQDFTFRSNHEIMLDNQNLIKVGLEWNTISTFYESDQLFFENFSSDTILSNTVDIQADIFSLYGGYQFNRKEVVSNIGLRSSYYDPVQKWFVEPRFDIRFAVQDHFHLKGAASYHHQFVNQTSLSYFDNSDEFYWVLADEEVIPVQKSAHLIVGADYSVENWTFDIEYYLKNTTGVIDNQFLNLPPSLLELVIDEEIELAGENYASGIDFFAKYRNDAFTSWLSYSLGFSENQFSYQNDGDPYPSVFDQRHEINFANIFKTGRWELSSIFIFGSGKPYTPPVEDPESDFLYDLDRINQERLPAYSRLDLSAKYSFPIGKSRCEMGLTLFNILDKQNIRSRRYTRQFLFDETAGNSTVVSDEVRIVALDTYLLGFTPNFFFNIKF